MAEFNSSMSAYIRTRYNALINITDTNWSAEEFQIGPAMTDVFGPINSSWIFNITIDDTNRDDDESILLEQLIAVTFDNGTGSDVGTTVVKSPSDLWQTDPDDSTKTSYRSRYGALIEVTDPTDSPEEIVVTIPENILRPLVYVSSGAITVSGTGSTVVGNAVVIYDNQASSMADKQLIVVGGSCINTIAAKLLGSSAPVCESVLQI